MKLLVTDRLSIAVFALQVRVEQVLVSEPGAVQLYKLANLVKFYQTTIRYQSQLTRVANLERCLGVTRDTLNRTSGRNVDVRLPYSDKSWVSFVERYLFQTCVKTIVIEPSCPCNSGRS